MLVCKRRLAVVVTATACVVSVAAQVPPGVTSRVSVATGGTEGNASSAESAISVDGRYVAFSSVASNLVPDDTNNAQDVFVHDRNTATTVRVSVASNGTQGNASSGSPAISGDGRFVAFVSSANNLVADDTNGFPDVFIHDRDTGTTTRVSLAGSGAQTNDRSADPTLSHDGRYVAFTSDASNLVAGDSNGFQDAFVHDCVTGATTRASISSAGTQGDMGSYYPMISADGVYVVFSSDASNLVAGDTNGYRDIFVHDRNSTTTTRVSVASDGGEANSYCELPAISANGRYIAFASSASNLVTGDTSWVSDVFVHDRDTGATVRVSVATDGTLGDQNSSWPVLSADGRFVAFSSTAGNLVAGDTNGEQDVFVHDRNAGTTTRVSVATGGTQENAASWFPAISADGHTVAFESRASNLVAGDTNGAWDVFVNNTPAPGVTNISPTQGPTSGGTDVTLSGSGFENGATVAFGGTPATTVSVVNATTISATTPEHAAGAVDVVVTNPDTQPGTLAGGFTYVACTLTIDPTTASPGAGGGAGSVSVTANASLCAWTAVSNAAWIVVNPSSASGSGSGTVHYTVAANPLHASRVATMTIAGQSFTVTQAGVVCTITIDPTSVSPGAAGGSGSVAVTANAADCGWTAVSQEAWVNVTGGGSGTGNGTVQYLVNANVAPGPRQGAILIGGQTFSLSQADPNTVPGPPGGLSWLSTGSSLTLWWTTPSTGGLPAAYVIEAGTSSGLANLANFSTGNTLTLFYANGVPNGLYFLRVKAANGFGTSGPSNEALVRVGPAPPNPPTGLTASAIGSSLTLSWNAPLGGDAPTAYTIEAGSAPGLSNLANFSTGSTQTAFSASGVANGTYCVRVRATNVAGTSGPSNEAILQVGPPPPGPPSGLTASAVGWTVTLSWNAPTTGGAPTAYTIEAGSGPGLSNLASFSTNNTQTVFSVGGVVDRAYYLRVRASNAYGVSGPSNEVLLYVGCGGPPAAPSNFRITGNSGGSVAFAWNASIGSPTTYILEAGTTPGTTDLVVLDLGGPATTFTANGVGAGTYYVRLRANNACGTSGVSNEVVLIVP